MARKLRTPTESDANAQTRRQKTDNIRKRTKKKQR
jgi:hypothetical protein